MIIISFIITFIIIAGSAINHGVTAVRIKPQAVSEDSISGRLCLPL